MSKKSDYEEYKQELDAERQKQRAFEKKLAIFLGICLLIGLLLLMPKDTGGRSCGQYDVDGVTCVAP